MDLASSIIELLIGLTIFIVAMNMMSSGLKKATGKGLKRIFKRTANNRFIGLGIGTSVTALIQSSAATSVLVVGFLNAGVMSLFQGIAIIMGSNIGTTVTGLLVSMKSIKISPYFSLLAFVGLILVMFCKKEKLKSIGEVLCGLGLVFVGLSMISGAFDGEGNQIKEGFQFLFIHIEFPLLIVLLGAIFTALVQSSSAASGVVIVLVGTGAISFTEGMYLIIGATIGTWFTTFIASLNGNVNAKRACYASLIIKLAVAIIGLAIIWPVESLTGSISKFFGLFPTPELSTAMFFVLFNTIGMLLLLPFIKLIERASILMVRDKEAEKNKRRLKFIDDRMLNTPSVALMLTKKEIENMFNLAKTNINLSFNEVKNLTFESSGMIEDIEDTVDYINNAVTTFLINLSNKVTLEDEKTIGSYFHIINDIERIGDHAYNFHEMAKKLDGEELKFSDTAKGEFDQLMNVITRMFDVAEKCFDSNNMDDIKELKYLEGETDRLKTLLSSKHFDRLSTGNCNMKMSPFYSSLVSELERVADHLFNVGYAFINPTGDVNY